MKNASNQRGFTLVELAISMIIIGLLIVGVLAGSSIIKSAKIRSVLSDIYNYQTAFDLFTSKYGGMPGDAADITDSLPAATNGNGDGQITWSNGEGAQAWYQMSLAGMVSGNLSGTVNGTADAVLDNNIPSSKISGTGYAIDYDGSTTGTSNHLHFAAQSAVGAGINNGAAVSPADALTIDKKIDDGISNTGRVQDSGLANCSAAGVYTLAGGDTPACALNIQLDSSGNGN